MIRDTVVVKTLKDRDRCVLRGIVNNHDLVLFTQLRQNRCYLPTDILRAVVDGHADGKSAAAGDLLSYSDLDALEEIKIRECKRNNEHMPR